MTTKAQAIKAVETLAAFNPEANAIMTAEALCMLYPDLDKLNTKPNGKRVYTWWNGTAHVVCEDGDIRISRDQFNAGFDYWDGSRDLAYYTKAFEC